MISSAEELGNFMMDYYRTRALKQLAEALEYAATARDFPDEFNRGLALYFFARVGRLQPEVVLLYERVLRKSSQEGKDFVLSVIQLARNTQAEELPHPVEPTFPADFDVLERPVRQPGDLDYLWTEFSVTGTKEPVHKVIDVVAWPDRVRFRLEKWLQVPASDFLSRWKRKRALNQLERIAGIICDAATNEIRTVGDLDLHTFSLAKKEGFEKVRPALPFDLSQEDLHYIATKGAAHWSLSGIAARHAPVLDACREELERHSEPARHTLEQVITSASGQESAEIIQPDGESHALHRKHKLEELVLFILVAAAVGFFYQSFALFFLELVEAAPTLSLVSGIACLVLAVLGGAYRQVNSYLIARTASIPLVGEHGQEKSVLLGTYNPAWLSRKMRVLTWVGVTATTLWAAGVGAAMVSTSSEFESFLEVFLLAVAARWGVSALLVRLARPEKWD
jgi:hypothetical protein